MGETREAGQALHAGDGSGVAGPSPPGVARCSGVSANPLRRPPHHRRAGTGDLTITGTTRPLTFDLAYAGAVIDDDGVLRIGLEGATTVNRRDWGLSWNFALEAGGVLVSDKVTIELDVAAVRADPATGQ